MFSIFIGVQENQKYHECPVVFIPRKIRLSYFATHWKAFKGKKKN
jgi:hypothetical protein